MDIWTSQSEAVKQRLLAIVCAAAGLILAIGFYHFDGAGSNSRAGFLLGLILLAIGIAGFFWCTAQSVVVDPRTRRITVTDVNRFSTRKRVIPFGSIVDIRIGYLGKKSNYVTWYYLILKLNSGEEYSLFSPGRFFAGGSDRSVVEGWRLRLQKYLTPDSTGLGPPHGKI